MESKRKIGVVTCALLGLLCISAALAARLKSGDKAPEFTLRDENGDERSLSSYAGKKVALYFYPKNDTPGCTEQACSLRDGFKQLGSKGIVVLGVSYGSPASNKKFKEKHSLPFILLSDSKKKVARAYGATVWYSFGFFPRRVTILIDEKGYIVDRLRSVDVSNHADQIIKAFKDS